jgi:hypothetical protein
MRFEKSPDIPIEVIISASFGFLVIKAKKLQATSVKSQHSIIKNENAKTISF